MQPLFCNHSAISAFKVLNNNVNQCCLQCVAEHGEGGSFVDRGMYVCIHVCIYMHVYVYLHMYARTRRSQIGSRQTYRCMHTYTVNCHRTRSSYSTALYTSSAYSAKCLLDFGQMNTHAELLGSMACIHNLSISMLLYTMQAGGYCVMSSRRWHLILATHALEEARRAHH